MTGVGMWGWDGGHGWGEGGSSNLDQESKVGGERRLTEVKALNIV